MEKLTLSILVSEDDIRIGKPCSNRVCPVAIAIARAIDVLGMDFEYVHVGLHFVNVWVTMTKVFHSDLPQEVFNFIDAFDAGIKVSPFAFDLTLTKV